MSALVPYFQNTLGAADTMGHPFDLGFDDDELGAAEMMEVQDEIGAGVPFMQAIRRARARARSRRAARQQARAPQVIYACPHGGAGMPYGRPYGRLRGEDDELGGEDDDWDVSADEDEVEDLGADDDDELGDDSDHPQVLGASLARLENRVSRLQMKRAEVQAKLDATPRFRTRRRRRLAALLQKIDRKLSRKAAKAAKKKARMEARFGYLPDTRPAPMGYDRLLNQPQFGTYRASAPSGAELYIPLRFSGANYLVATFAAAAAAGSTFSIDAETPAVNYADLQITGIQMSIEIIADREAVGGFNPNDIGVITQLTTLLAAGNVNAFYADQVLPGSGEVAPQASAPNHIRSTYRMTGLRDNSVLEKNGTATLTGSCEIPISPETAVSVVITGSLICQRLRDAVLDRRAA